MTVVGLSGEDSRPQPHDLWDFPQSVRPHGPAEKVMFKHHLHVSDVRRWVACCGLAGGLILSSGDRSACAQAPLIVPPHSEIPPIIQWEQPPPLQSVAPTPLPSLTPCGPLLPGGIPVDGGHWMPGGIVHTANHPLSRNCNFAVRATEDFANRIVARCQTQAGPVQDFVLGANVLGNQSTTTNTRLNFVPCEGAARFNLEVRGEVDSRTVGITRQAQIQTHGRHQFLLSKEIEFDGRLTKTRSPLVTVTPSQQHVGATTVASGMPLIGQWAEGFALQQANARNPIAARITAEKISREAAPEFNQRIDTELERLNRQLSGPVQQQLERWQLAPQSHLLSTTEDDLLWCVTLDVPTAAPPLPPESLTTPARAGALYLHDSLVNDLLDRVPIAGVGLPDSAIDHWFSALASGEGLAALSRRPGPTAPQLATIMFDRERPIRLRFEDQRFELVLRIGIIPVAGPQIPTQEITIPFTVKVENTNVHFHPGDVRIAPGDPAAPSGVLDEAARVLIRQQVQSRLESRTAPRRIPLELPDAPSAEVEVRSVTLREGWLSVEFD